MKSRTKTNGLLACRLNSLRFRRLTEIRGQFIADCLASLITPGSRVLDLGCGNGVVSAIICDRFRLDFVGADVRQALVTDIPFTAVTPYGELPFAPGSFDAVLLNDVLHHFPSQMDLIDRALRVGRRVFAFEDKPSRTSGLLERVINFVHYGGLPGGYNRDAAGWRRFLAVSGYDFEVREVGRPTAWYPFEHFVIVIGNVQGILDRQLPERQGRPG
ncbi:MAG: class I SAM-dependent methyltransferase [Patescibacteria group bacterium]|nr:class I SAM-dependent methyltransferase [Patescibacteria group bacterium]